MKAKQSTGDRLIIIVLFQIKINNNFLKVNKLS